MRKIVALIAVILLFSVMLTSCSCQDISLIGSIEYNDDDSITYNEVKYFDAKNYSGKIDIDYSSERCVKIGIRRYVLWSISVFYGNEKESPDIIACSRGNGVWIREGLDIDELIMKNICVASETLSFRICDIITDETVPYVFEDRGNASTVVDFEKFSFEDYPAFGFSVDIVSIDGQLYLQYNWDSDYYKITSDFEAELRTAGFIN